MAGSCSIASMEGGTHRSKFRLDCIGEKRDSSWWVLAHPCLWEAGPIVAGFSSTIWARKGTCHGEFLLDLIHRKRDLL